MNYPCQSCHKAAELKHIDCRLCKICDPYREWFIKTWDTNRLRILELLTEKEKNNDANKSV